MAYQFCMGYLMPKFDSFVNVWSKSLLFIFGLVSFICLTVHQSLTGYLKLKLD